MQQDESDRVFPAKRNCTEDKLTQFDFYQFLECQTAESSTSCISCNNRRNTPLATVLLVFLILYKKYTRSSSSSPWAAPTVPGQSKVQTAAEETATDGAMPTSELTAHDSPFLSAPEAGKHPYYTLLSPKQKARQSNKRSGQSAVDGPHNPCRLVRELGSNALQPHIPHMLHCNEPALSQQLLSPPPTQAL